MAQVQVIQPYQPQSDALEKVAAYCRVSTDSKDQLNSYRTQIGYYTNFIAQHPGWELADIYADEGITGTSLEKRDEFKRMLEDIETGTINLVIVKDLSRFGREYAQMGLYIEHYFEEKGVRFISVAENIDSKNGIDNLVLPFTNVINSFYARQASTTSPRGTNARPASSYSV